MENTQQPEADSQETENLPDTQQLEHDSQEIVGSSDGEYSESEEENGVFNYTIAQLDKGPHTVCYTAFFALLMLLDTDMDDLIEWIERMKQGNGDKTEKFDKALEDHHFTLTEFHAYIIHVQNKIKPN